MDGQKLVLITSSVIFSFAMLKPSHTSQLVYKVVNEADGLRVSISRFSPPMAAVVDEQLPVVFFEPRKTLTGFPKAKKIEAGEAITEKKMKVLAKFFSKKNANEILLAKKIQTKTKPKVVAAKAPKPAQLTRLIVAVPTREIGTNAYTQQVLVTLGMIKAPAPSAVLARAISKLESHPRAIAGVGLRGAPVSVSMENVRARIDESSASKIAAAPTRIAADNVTTEKVSPVKINLPANLQELIETSARINEDTKFMAAPESRGAESASVEGVSGQGIPGFGASVEGSNKVSQAGQSRPAIVVQPAPVKPQAPVNPQPAPSGGDISVRGTNPEEVSLGGQIELRGGLAATGVETKLLVQWQKGKFVKDAIIDYTTGKFAFNIADPQGGKIIGRVIDSHRRMIGFGEVEFDDIKQNYSKIYPIVHLVIEPQQTEIDGKAFSAYSENNDPTEGGQIFGPVGSSTTIERGGKFNLPTLNSDSLFVAEAYLDNHWGTRFFGSGARKNLVPLFSERFVQGALEKVGQTNGNSELGIVFGEIKHKGKLIAGAVVGISANDAIGPFYFNQLRIPDPSLTSTTANGMFAFFKVSPGLHLVMSRRSGQEMPSTVISVGQGLISYADIQLKSLRMKGRIYDPFLRKNITGKVAVIGSSVGLHATATGFLGKVPSSDSMVTLDVTPEKDYLQARYTVGRAESHDLDLFVFKKTWIKQLFKSAEFKYSEKDSALIGYVKGPGFHVSLDGQQDRDFDQSNISYLDEKGAIGEGQEEGRSGGGAFLVRNLKPGPHSLVVTSAEGDMVTSRIFVSEPGILNVLSINLRP